MQPEDWIRPREGYTKYCHKDYSVCVTIPKTKEAMRVFLTEDQYEKWLKVALTPSNPAYWLVWNGTDWVQSDTYVDGAIGDEPMSITTIDQEKKCTCDMDTIMRSGCKCGGK